MIPPTLSSWDFCAVYTTTPKTFKSKLKLTNWPQQKNLGWCFLTRGFNYVLATRRPGVQLGRREEARQTRWAARGKGLHQLADWSTGTATINFHERVEECDTTPHPPPLCLPHNLFNNSGIGTDKMGNITHYQNAQRNAADIIM